jgi:hypothetical protein
LFHFLPVEKVLHVSFREESITKGFGNFEKKCSLLKREDFATNAVPSIGLENSPEFTDREADEQVGGSSVTETNFGKGANPGDWENPPRGETPRPVHPGQNPHGRTEEVEQFMLGFMPSLTDHRFSSHNSISVRWSLLTSPSTNLGWGNEPIISTKSVPSFIRCARKQASHRRL